MDINDIDAVLNLSGTLESHGYSDAAHTPGLLQDLFNWADSRANQLAAGHSDDSQPTPLTSTPKAKKGKTTESRDSDTFEATPDPSADSF